MNAKALSMVAAALVVGVMFSSAPAEARAQNDVYVKNCSNWLNVTVKSRPEWRTGGLPHQGQYGTRYPINRGEIAHMKCNAKRHFWERRKDNCNISVEKTQMQTTTGLVRGNVSFVEPGSPLQWGHQC
ncbi:MAG: hypothetical protein ACFB3T_07100 [Geminicoccaceae bacterium]